MPRIAILLSLALVACAPAAPPPPPPPAAASAPAAPAPAAAAQAPATADGATLTINAHGGAEVVSVQTAADGSLAITFTEGGQKTSLTGSAESAGKRKYKAGDAVLFETKWDDDGFKLRGPGGALLYKIKLKDDKIKVSDNEESANPFELKAREGNRIKVVAPGDKEIGNVRANVVEDGSGKKLFDANGRPGSAGYGVLLLGTIPAAQRYVILAELFSRGK